MIPDLRSALIAEDDSPEEKKDEAPPEEEQPEERPEEEAEPEEPAEEEEEEEEEEQEDEPAADKSEKARKKAAAEEEKKKGWRGKVKAKGADGKDAEEEIELSDEEIAQIVGRRRSLDRAAFGWSEKLKEAERDKAELDRLIHENPFAVLQKAGLDPFQTALAYLKEQVDFANLPPEQKAQLQLAQERSRLEEERRKFDDDKNAADREVKKTTYRERVLRELPAAMDKRGLVKHPLVMSLINDIGTAQMFSSRSDFPDLDNAAEETESLLREASSAWLGNLAEKNPAALMQVLPPAVVKAVKAQALASAKKNPTRPAVPGTSPSAPRPPRRSSQEETKPTYKTPQEWRQGLIADANRRG